LFFFILALGLVSCVYYPPVIFLNMTIHDYSNNPQDYGASSANANKDDYCAYDFPRRHTTDGPTGKCVQPRLSQIDKTGNYVPTPTRSQNCPRDIDQWFAPNEKTADVPIRLMATKISDNPPLYKFQETGTPGFSPLPCTNDKKISGWGCTTSSGSSTTKCFQNSWDLPSCFNGYYAMSFHAWIYYNRLTPLLVKSDDDSWTFINERLAVDYGGTHGDGVIGSTSYGSDFRGKKLGPVNVMLSTLANDLELQEDNFYRYDMYYAERGASIAGLTFVISPTPVCSAYNISGCCDDSIDSDNDGLNDCFDGCPHNPKRYGPGTCGCDSPDSCEETKHCALYTKATCASTAWARSNCGICGDYCVTKSEANSCPCSSFKSDQVACTAKSTCSFCDVGKYCTDKGKCQCADVSKNYCTNGAITLSGGKCSYCYDTLCQDAACLGCNQITNDTLCNNDSRCKLCDETKYKKACVSVGATSSCVPDCSKSYYQDDTRCSSESACRSCGNNKCLSNSQKCPDCSSYTDPTKCNNAPGCAYCDTMKTCLKSSEVCQTCSMMSSDFDCEKNKNGQSSGPVNCKWCDVGTCFTQKEINERYNGSCPACGVIDESHCDSNQNCHFCLGLCLDIPHSQQCPDCSKLSDSECLKSSVCHLCGPNRCSSSVCPQCSEIKTSQQQCVGAFSSETRDSMCTYCNSKTNECKSSLDLCSPCESLITEDVCLASVRGCVWCGSMCKQSIDDCPDCPTYSQSNCTKVHDKNNIRCQLCDFDHACTSDLSTCNRNCSDITDSTMCDRNCVWCGSKCIFNTEECPSCDSYNGMENDCSNAFVFSGGQVTKCQFCEDDQKCQLSSQACFINCSKIEIDVPCKAALNCTWCGNGLCAFASNQKDYAECPSCSSYTDKTSCHNSIRACSWCKDGCYTRADCIADAAVKIASISAGIIAAIVVAAVVALIIITVSSRKVYALIMESQQQSMTTANDSSIYEAKDNGGENPLAQ